MLLKYIEIGCRNLQKAKNVFSTNFAFSVIHEDRHLCVLKSRNFDLILKKDSSDFTRVTNVALSCHDLNKFKYNISNHGLKSSDISESCPYHPGVPYLDVPSPFSHLHHRVYQDAGLRSGRIEQSQSTHEIDHVLYCCNPQTAKLHAQWYSRLLNVSPYPFAGSHSGAMKVVVNGSGMEMFVNCGEEKGVPIFAFSEPITSNSTGYNQIERFLSANKGGGVQHIALKTNNIFKTISDLRGRGVKIIEQPYSYYALEEKQRQFEELDLDPLLAFENSIIVDKDSDGYLLQVFTESMLDKDGMFFEVIERRGSRGFGTGNVKALFAALQEKMDSAAS